jgi:2-keto-4-pentenoate hydratase/2-oxohepta-3-ene-1,7-dioic acid hydratase in catechol pathway
MPSPTTAVVLSTASPEDLVLLGTRANPEERSDVRFVTFEEIAAAPANGVTRVGVLADSVVMALPPGMQLMDLLRRGPDRLREEGERALRQPHGSFQRDEIRLSAPLPAPPTIRDFMVFPNHVKGTGLLFGRPEIPAVWWEQPVFYFTNPYAVVGPYDDVPMPPGCVDLDFELEVAAVVGRSGRDLTVEDAQDAIVGYTIMNDWSARDLQAQEMTVGLGPAKGKDSATTLGPVLVTSDELEPFRSGTSFALEMSVSVNGQPFGTDRLDHMAWSFAEMVAYASRGTWVRPGDVLGSGTCGNGCLAELWGRQGRGRPPIGAGDVVSMTVEQLGTIENRVVRAPAASNERPAWLRNAADRRDRVRTATAT